MAVGLLFQCRHPVYLVGYRTKESIENLLGSEFAGWLMSDGYVIYRDYLRRLRCWAHLVRKAKGLQESMNRAHAQPFGNAALGLLEELMAAVYQAREGPPTHLQPLYSQPLKRFKVLCEGYRDCPHKKTRALARVSQRLGRDLGGTAIPTAALLTN